VPDDSNVFPIFVGCQRSGTTLVRAIFDSHPELAVLHESHFLGPMARRRNVYDTANGFRLDRFITDLRKRFPFDAHGVSEASISASFDRVPPTDFADAVRRIYALYAQGKGKARYADKTPGHVMDMACLGEVFPEARFVHIVRDGRDVALALQDVEWGPEGIGAAALYWRQRVELGIRAGRALRDRYREVRYEDLLADPQGVVRSLCDFLNLAFADEMLRYGERADEVAAETHHPHQHSRLVLPPTRGLRDWRRSMAREDVAVFELLAGDILADLGYARASDELPARTRLDARRRALAAHLRRLPKRARRRALRMLSVAYRPAADHSPIDSRVGRQTRASSDDGRLASPSD
jgi:hypothetical protein